MSYVMRLMAIEDRILRVIGSDRSGGDRGGDSVADTHGFQTGGSRIAVLDGGVPLSDFVVDLGTYVQRGFAKGRDINLSSYFNDKKDAVRRPLEIKVNTSTGRWSFVCGSCGTYSVLYTGLKFCPTLEWNVYYITLDPQSDVVTYVSIFVNGSETLVFSRD